DDLVPVGRDGHDPHRRQARRPLRAKVDHGLWRRRLPAREPPLRGRAGHGLPRRLPQRPGSRRRHALRLRRRRIPRPI
ncbi:MAG: Uncharacterized MFS-type transporter, partial [uncultured Rubrobacteraceae bacterium]